MTKAKRCLLDTIRHSSQLSSGNMSQEQKLLEALEILEKVAIDYRGAANTYATYGMRASAKDALETSDYIEAFLKGKI